MNWTQKDVALLVELLKEGADLHRNEKELIADLVGLATGMIETISALEAKVEQLAADVAALAGTGGDGPAPTA